MEADFFKSLLDNSNKLLKDLQLRDPDKRIGAPIFLRDLTAVACLTGLLVSCLIIDRFEDFTIWGLEAWRWWGLLFVLVAGGMAMRLLMVVVLVSLDHGNSALRRKIRAKNTSLPGRKKSELGEKVLELGEKVLELGEKVAQVVSSSWVSIQAVLWIDFILRAWILLFRKGVNLPDHRSDRQNLQAYRANRSI